MADVARSLAGRRAQVFTDFDGTLVGLVPDPLHVELSGEVRAALDAVAARHRLAVVSGRDLANLRERVRLPVAYAGNHGLEISGPGFDHTVPTGGDMGAVVAELRAALPGVWVQDKRLTATVHLPGDSPVRAVVERVVGGRFAVRPGRATIDVRPAVDWHKGSAVRWLRERWNDTDAVPVFLGDDPTDEDGFAACADGVTVLVGPGRPTLARHRLPDPAAVAAFLRELAG
jgi:trehalose-phosphatase